MDNLTVSPERMARHKQDKRTLKFCLFGTFPFFLAGFLLMTFAKSFSVNNLQQYLTLMSIALALVGLGAGLGMPLVPGGLLWKIFRLVVGPVAYSIFAAGFNVAANVPHGLAFRFALAFSVPYYAAYLAIWYWDTKLRPITA